jgi:hypothetical protein
MVETGGSGASFQASSPDPRRLARSLVLGAGARAVTCSGTSPKRSISRVTAGRLSRSPTSTAMLTRCGPDAMPSASPPCWSANSYGGMVITDAGTHDAVAGLAYVAAYMPDNGQTLMDLWTQAELPEAERPSELVAAVRLSDDRPECGSMATVSPARCTETATRRPTRSRSPRSPRPLGVWLGSRARPPTCSAPRTGPSRHRFSAPWPSTQTVCSTSLRAILPFVHARAARWRPCGSRHSPGRRLKTSQNRCHRLRPVADRSAW